MFITYFCEGKKGFIELPWQCLTLKREEYPSELVVIWECWIKKCNFFFVKRKAANHNHMSNLTIIPDGFASGAMSPHLAWFLYDIRKQLIPMQFRYFVQYLFIICHSTIRQIANVNGFFYWMWNFFSQSFMLIAGENTFLSLIYS